VKTAADRDYQRKLDLVRKYREAGYDVDYVVWDYSDYWHPFVVGVFNNIVAALEVTGRNDDYEWDVIDVHSTPESFDRSNTNRSNEE
jgi:hypothetical protein